MDTKKQIYHLLCASQDPLATQVLAAVKDPLLHFHSTRPIPTKQTKSIYRLRAKTNERNGNPTEGFAELLTGFDQTTSDACLVHSLQTNLKKFIVFTDAAVTQLVGILKIPVETGAETAIAAQPLN